ncbi:MAG TPA: lytic transglycosylase domain-containing protein [Terriglobia bacterium]|nr:lytic transglycosylase domain-containing protein [Terriglobia bacterium]
MTVDQIKHHIIETAKTYNTSVLQCLAQAKAESGFNPFTGESSINPFIGVFRPVGIKLEKETSQNIDGGVRYIKQCNSLFPERLDLALVAYSWGIENAFKMIWAASGYPPSANEPPPATWPSTDVVVNTIPPETRDYIERVMQYMFELQRDPVYLASSGAS